MHPEQPHAKHAQCVVCEGVIQDDEWLARIEHGDWTVLLCSQHCIDAFFAQRVPGLRRLALLAAHPSLTWPQAEIGALASAA